MLGRFDDLIRSEAARADANPLDAAINERPNRLKVWFEPARTDVVRVAHLPADCRRLAANLATLCHDFPVDRE